MYCLCDPQVCLLSKGEQAHTIPKGHKRHVSPAAGCLKEDAMGFLCHGGLLDSYMEW